MARSFWRVLGATSTGLVAVGTVAAAALLAGPWATAVAEPGPALLAQPARAVNAAPAPAQLVCAPAATLPEGADVGDSQFSATPVGTASHVVAGVLGKAGHGAAWTPLGGPAAPLHEGGAMATLSADPGDAGGVIATQPVSGEAFRAAGVTSSVTTSGDLRGLAATPCSAPAISQWIVGGSTEVGSTALLTVQNPSAGPATVTLAVYGPSGQVALGSQGAFVLGPGQTKVTRLEAVAPDQRRVAVHVASTGGRVTAHLQVQSLDGLLARGVDLLGPGVGPSTSVAIPGVMSGGEALDDPNAPVLRLLVPGTAGGTARVRIYGPSGRVFLRGADSLDLAPGTVTDLPLGGLPAGGYGIVVDADVPVVAAAQYTRQAATPPHAVVAGTLVDVAWVAGQPLPEPGAAAQVAVPPSVGAVMSLTGVPEDRDATEPEGKAAAVLTAYGADGTKLGSRDVSIPAGSVVRTAVASIAGEGTPAFVTVDAGDGARVAWALELSASDGHTADRLVAALAPTSSVPAPGAVQVREVDARR